MHLAMVIHLDHQNVVQIKSNVKSSRLYQFKCATDFSFTDWINRNYPSILFRFFYLIRLRLKQETKQNKKNLEHIGPFKIERRLNE